MTTVDTAPRPHDRHSRRRPFSSLMKRLASLKYSSSDSGPHGTSKRNPLPSQSKSKKSNSVKNNPYPISGKQDADGVGAEPVPDNGHLPAYTPPSGRSISYASPLQSKISLPASRDGQIPPTISTKSAAPTVSTNPDTVNSDNTNANSKAGTTATLGGGVSSSGVGGGEGSTFSSPAPSVRSLSTTLTTMQSTAASNLLAAPANQPPSQSTSQTSNHGHHSSSTSQFQHQFPPSSSPPASAVPSHLTNHTSGGHPATYTTATANNLLTDNASIMTLASSSKRRRRNSLDTNASVRALAPSSLYGGSKESLPLSVLSSNITADQASITAQPPQSSRQVSVGLANAERASVYSSSGIVPALSSERNSYYAGKTNPGGDGGSVRSGLMGHGRNDSITRSLSGLATESPLNSPKDLGQERVSLRSSGWGEVKDEDDIPDEEEDDEEKAKGKKGGE